MQQLEFETVRHRIRKAFGRPFIDPPPPGVVKIVIPKNPLRVSRALWLRLAGVGVLVLILLTGASYYRGYSLGAAERAACLPVVEIIHQSLIHPGGPTDADVGEAEGQMAVCDKAREALGAEIHANTEWVGGIEYPWLTHPIGSMFSVAEMFGIIFAHPTMLSRD
jgi:hypothetical protein